MNDPLEKFRGIILVSGLTCVALVGLLLLLTKWRPSWQRLLNAEGTFWRRLGLKGNWVAPVRRFEESRGVVYVLAGLLVLHVVLTATAAGAYFYFAPKFKKARSAQVHPGTSAPGQKR